jgi:hypothetical protein
MHRPPEVREGMVGVMNSAALIQQTIDNTLTAKRLSAEVNAQVIEDGLRGSPEPCNVLRRGLRALRVCVGFRHVVAAGV